MKMASLPPLTQCMGQPGGAEGPGVKFMVESCDDGEKEAKLGLPRGRRRYRL